MNNEKLNNMRKPVLIACVAALIVLGMLIISSINSSRHRAEGAKLVTTITSPDQVDAIGKECIETHQSVCMFFSDDSQKCRVEESYIDEAAYEYKGRVKFVKVALSAKDIEAMRADNVSLPALMFANLEKPSQAICINFLSRKQLKLFIEKGLSAQPGSYRIYKP